MGTVYLLHFARPVSERHTCQHYLGWTTDLDARMAAHRAGRGARLCQVAMERGIDFTVAATWAGDRTVERRLKARKESPRLCPICYPSRRPLVIAEQLALPFDQAEPWADEPAPSTRIDWLEITYQRRWASLREPLPIDVPDELI